MGSQKKVKEKQGEETWTFKNTNPLSYLYSKWPPYYNNKK
jgi:hypothetical protein